MIARNFGVKVQQIELAPPNVLSDLRELASFSRGCQRDANVQGLTVRCVAGRSLECFLASFASCRRATGFEVFPY